MLLHIEGERAKRRMAVRSIVVLPVANSPQVNDQGKAREKVAEALGSGQKKVTQAAAVVQAIDDLEASGDKRQAAQLRTMLNKKSVNAAYQHPRTCGYNKALQPKPERHVLSISLRRWHQIEAARVRQQRGR